MSNSLTAFNEEFWSAEMQTIFFKENVAISISNSEMRELLSAGDTVNKPYRSHPVVQTYTKGTDITAKDVSGTNEQLSVDTAKLVAFYVDDIDALQNKWDMASRYAQDAMRALNNVLDQAVMAEYSNATSTIDDGDIGGTDGNLITLSTSNIQQIFTASARKLDQLNIPQAGRFACVGPRMLEMIRLYIGGKDTSMADIVGNNGRVMERFGFELYYTNNLPFTATWTPVDQPADAQTVTIAGVVFTFETGTLATAGQVKSETSVAVSIDNLVAMVNGTETSGTEGVSLSDANRWKLEQAGVTATDGTTAMTIVAYGDITVATSVTADAWTVQTQHALFGLKGATDLVVQKSPNVVFKEAEKRLGRYVYPWMLYGKKTFADMKDALVDVQINASAWS